MNISCHLSKSSLKCWWLQGNPCWNSIAVYPVTLALVPLTVDVVIRPWRSTEMVPSQGQAFVLPHVPVYSVFSQNAS